MLHGAPNTCVAMMALAPSRWAAASSVSIWKSQQAVDERGVRPFHITAWADAGEREAGHHDRAGATSVRRLHDEHEPRRARAERDDVRDAEPFAMRTSSSATSGPLVSMPSLYDGSSRRITRSSGGRAGRTNGGGRERGGSAE